MAIQYYSAIHGLPTTPSQLGTWSTAAGDDWLMTDAERSALETLLSTLRPECAIEVGTYRAGSLRVLAKHAKRVYSIDIDPSCAQRYSAEFPNVEFIVGQSREVLPALLRKLEAEGVHVGLILIDADHSRRGVREDINMALALRPKQHPTYIVVHDSFNPACRRGMKEANWSSNPCVHLVELDFVVGRFVSREEPDSYRQMWCGLALAILLPQPRTGEIIIHENESLMFRTAFWHSAHRFQTYWNPVFLGAAVLRRSKRLWTSLHMRVRGTTVIPERETTRHDSGVSLIVGRPPTG